MHFAFWLPYTAPNAFLPEKSHQNDVRNYVPQQCPLIIAYPAGPSTGLQLIHINACIVSEWAPIGITKRALSRNWGCRNKIRALSGSIRVQQVDAISDFETWCLQSLI